MLVDAGYGSFVLDLLKQATRRIWLMMFFFRFENRKAYVTDKQMEQLIGAKQRGVDVRVILDRQESGDVKPSLAVNTEAFEYLKENGIQVVFDSETRATHSKVLLVDDDRAQKVACEPVADFVADDQNARVPGGAQLELLLGLIADDDGVVGEEQCRISDEESDVRIVHGLKPGEAGVLI